MKKIKIMLLLISIFSVIGGILAFKMHNSFYGGNLQCTTWEESKIGTTYCPLESYCPTDIEPLRSLCKNLGALPTQECIEKGVKECD